MPSFQEMIEASRKTANKEEEREFVLIIKFKMFGKLDQCWKTALSVYRNLRTMMGNMVTFCMQDGQELTDSFSDDDGEMWHSHDWKADPDPRDEQRHPDITEGHPAERKYFQPTISGEPVG